MFLFDTGGRLNFHEIKPPLTVWVEDVDSRPDALVGEGCFVQGWDVSVGQKGLGCPDRLAML
jgi:hypothetical protein